MLVYTHSLSKEHLDDLPIVLETGRERDEKRVLRHFDTKRGRENVTG